MHTFHIFKIKITVSVTELLFISTLFLYYNLNVPKPNEEASSQYPLMGWL